ncbi:MscS family membrane protein [Pedobacter sp. UYP30]|uniref:mechanosensitive ion channel family protein n=1 Tax=Pedobacter sp. UYP30 TaxID=1756400 RepID=UPI003392361D
MLNTPFFEQVFWGNPIRNYCFFLLFLFVGLVFRKLISKLLGKLLVKLFRNFAAQSHDAAFIALLLKPLQLFLLLTTLYFAANQLSYPLNQVLFQHHKLLGKTNLAIPITIGDGLDKIFLFLIIISIFWIILRIIDFISHVFLYKATFKESKTESQLIPFLKELFKALIIFVAFFTLLGYVFEVNVLTLITGLGIGGIAIALAAKESLENLLGSFTIFLDKPFIVGDYVKVDNVEGVIEKVGFRSTWIRTVDKTMVTIPNKGMIDGVLENMSLRNIRRVKFTVGVTYETPKEQVEKIVEKIKAFLLDHTDTNNDGIVYFDGFGASSLDIVIIYYITELDLAKYVLIKQEINFKIMDTVLGNNSDFAYPTQRLITTTPNPIADSEEPI